MIQVDWSAAVSGTAGAGTVGGSLGVFDVTAAPQSFVLGHNLTAVASGFSSGVANGSYPYGTGDQTFQFTSLTSGSLIGSGVYLFAPGVGSAPGCPSTLCGIGISAPNAADVADGGNATISTGSILFTFTPVPEPTTVLLLMTGVLSLVTIKHRRA
jgi:hypothetical protein